MARPARLSRPLPEPRPKGGGGEEDPRARAAFHATRSHRAPGRRFPEQAVRSRNPRPGAPAGWEPATARPGRLRADRPSHGSRWPPPCGVPRRHRGAARSGSGSAAASRRVRDVKFALARREPGARFRRVWVQGLHRPVYPGTRCSRAPAADPPRSRRSGSTPLAGNPLEADVRCPEPSGSGGHKAGPVARYLRVYPGPH